MASLRDLLGQKASVGSEVVRVMIVDDSTVVLSVFSRILATHPKIDIVCQASDAAHALKFLERSPVDVILLDIEMPNRSGLDALPEILEAGDGARVMIVSSFIEREGPAAIAALEMGACDTLSKPGRTGYRGQFAKLLQDRVYKLGRVKRDKATADNGIDQSDPVEAIATPACIAIGSSTGGLPSIYTLVGDLDPDIDCPIFITQHLPMAFLTFFAKQLGAATKRTVKVSTCGEQIVKNTIYIAPGDANLGLTVRDGRLEIKHLAKCSENVYCPSVDVMFESVAEHFGSTALAVVFSGMGNDGLYGAQILFQKNARIVAQDSDSSVVWGMPGSVARAGLASSVMNPKSLVRALNAGLRK